MYVIYVLSGSQKKLRGGSSKVRDESLARNSISMLPVASKPIFTELESGS